MDLKRVMPKSQQVIKSISIKKLKGIADLEEVHFDDRPLTAIMGVNGSGKSTILHALACCYRPLPDSDCRDWKFSNFFTPTSHDTWRGSFITMRHSYREGADEHPDEETTYQKASDRWSPKYSRRPERHVSFVGIKSCVPKIEEESALGVISFSTAQHEDSILIKDKLGYIFNKSYSEINIHTATKGRSYTGLETDAVKYSSLAMGAGEQRTIEILSAVFNSPKYGLILIDEIDLLLHTDALKKLIRVLFDRATEKSLQIVFTSHREAILGWSCEVSVKHIHSVFDSQTGASKTLCLSNSTPDAVYRLTGVMERSLEVFVEDGTAQAVVNHELYRRGLKKHTNITLYGAANNCFTVLGGMALAEKYEPERQVYVLDGDVLVGSDERSGRINKVVSGTEGGRDELRNACLDWIKKFRPNAAAPPAPEAQIHWMIRGIDRDSLNNSQKEIFDIAREINVEQDKHYLVGKILEVLNESEASGLPKIIDLAAMSNEWGAYVKEVADWLDCASSVVD